MFYKPVSLIAQLTAKVQHKDSVVKSTAHLLHFSPNVPEITWSFSWY